MKTIKSRYRLQSSAFERPDDNQKMAPKNIIFLSVEGNLTEVNYFSELNRHLNAYIVQVEILKRKDGDGASDPNQVLELLQECLSIQNEIIPSIERTALVDEYSEKIVAEFEQDSGDLDAQTQLQIKAYLENKGIDVEYRRKLSEKMSNADSFGIVVDRDSHCRSREKMEACIKQCSENGFGCYISNPCFEFWLLLHLCDVDKEFNDNEKDEFIINKRVSNKHSYIGKIVSERAGHGKAISASVFDSKYFPNIPQAIERAKSFATKYPDILDKPGTNIPDLFAKIGYPS